MIEQINALGYGPRLGLQTRIDSRAERLASLARVGNVYVNRNIVGAVVGVQPLAAKASRHRPQAGGPHHLRRFVAEPQHRRAGPPLRLDGAPRRRQSPPMGMGQTPLVERIALLRPRGRCALGAATATGPQDPTAQAQFAECAARPHGERATRRHRARGCFAVLGVADRPRRPWERCGWQQRPLAGGDERGLLACCVPFARKLR